MVFARLSFLAKIIGEIAMKVHFDNPQARRIQNVLEGLQFPCRKLQIVTIARTRLVDDSLISRFENLPDDEFLVIEEVIQKTLSA